MRSSGWVWLSIVACLLGASACAKSDDDDDVMTGTGGAGPGTGGTAPMVTGGTAAAGSGGMAAAGSGGGTAGMPGTGGMGTGGASAGAGGGGAGTGGTAAPMFTPGSPTFSAIFAEVITGTGCNAGTLCHAGTVGLLTMNDKDATYKALVGVKGMGTNLPSGGMPPTTPNCKDIDTTRVVPMDPDHSLLVLKVTNMAPCGTKMPPSNNMLDQAKVDQIKMWIMNGAKDD